MLKGTHILLRPVEPNDLDLLYSIENTPENWIVSGTHTPFSKKTLTEYLNSIQDIYKDKQLRLVICLGDNSIGLLDLFDFDPKNRKVGIGILIEEEHRGNGFAKEAIDLICDYVFSVLHCHQVYCNILSNNKKSIALFQNLGFTKNGALKDWVLDNGTWLDQFQFQKLNS